MSPLIKLLVTALYTLYVVAIVSLWIWVPSAVSMEPSAAFCYYCFGWMLMIAVAALPAFVYCALDDY